MKVTSSRELSADRVALGAETAMLDLYSGLKTPFSEDAVLLTDKHRQEVESFALAAVDAYGDQDGLKEQTLAERTYGVNSLVVRVDCTIVDDRIVPYELEDSPSGIGMTDRFMHAATGSGLKERVLSHYDQVTGDVPHVIISGARRHGTDDEIVVGRDRYHYTPGDFRIPDIGESGGVIIKAIPGNQDSHQPYLTLQKRCLAPLVTEGNKSYLERLGIVSVAKGIDDLLQTDGELESQVVKARLGSMAMGVTVYLRPEDEKIFGKHGTVKSGRLIRDLQKYHELGSGALVQRFEPPIQIDNVEGRNNAILRIFVLMQASGSTSVRGATAIGGAYVARPELIVHGASNAISGAVLVK